MPGSEGDDVIVVTDPENDDTNTLSDTGEWSTAIWCNWSYTSDVNGKPPGTVEITISETITIF